MIKNTLGAFALVTILSTQALAVKIMPTHFGQVFQNHPLKAKSQAIGGQVLYYGGPVIGHAQVSLILWGKNVSSATVRSMPDFYSSVLNSDYMDWLKIYNTNITAQNGQAGTNQTIGRGSFVQTIQISPSITSGTVTDAQIQAELQKQIDAQVIPAPTADSLFMIHFPKGITITLEDGSSSCSAFCAYHEGFKAKDGSPVFYSVIPDLDSAACSFGCGSGSSIDRITVSASHELIEAITDGFPTIGSNPAFPQAWNTSDGQEVGDLCQSYTANLKGKAGNYTIQQEFDNSTNSCTTADYTSN